VNDNHVEELIPPYLENELPKAERCAVEAHLATCAGCRASLEEFKRLEVSLMELAEDVPSWKTAETRFDRSIGLARRSRFASVVFAAPVTLGLAFVALGIVLFLRGRTILLSLQGTGASLSALLAWYQGAVSRSFAAATGADIVTLLAVYGLLTVALLYAGRELVLSIGRK
jgi:anti-sigma factor RsiW